MRELGIGMVGYAFMGKAHSQAWRNVHRFFDVPLAPRMAALCGRDPDRAAAAAAVMGWSAVETDWRELVGRDDVQLVDVCTPGDSHAEIALAALAAGKHVLCEKPLSNSVAEAEEMTAAAERAAADGVVAMVGFNYRRVPAIALARELVAAGRIGQVRHVRALYLQDWITDPQFPLVWRLQRDKAGSGALGDIGAHIVDLAQYVTGEMITGVSAQTETFVTERPLPVESSGLTAGGNGRAASGGQTGTVTVDDCAVFTARLTGGAMATFEATRFATGRKNAMRLEVNGSLGSIAFDFESMNELHFHDETEPATTAGFRRILVTEPSHPYVEAWWPPGHGLGYEHAFVHQAYDLLCAVAVGTAVPSTVPPTVPTTVPAPVPATVPPKLHPTFREGLQVQRVLDAVERSAADGSRFTPVEAATPAASAPQP